MENLKDLLGEDLFNQVKEKLGDKKLIINNGDYIPRTRLNEEIDKAKVLQEQLTSMQEQVGKLDELAKNNEELKKSLEDIKSNSEQLKQEYEQKILSMKRESMIEKNLSKFEAKNPKIIKNLLDLDAIKIDGDTVIGLKEQIEKIKETDPYLFGKDKEPPTPGHHKGGSQPKVNPFMQGEHFNLAKQVELKKSNPELARRLQEEALASN